MHLPQGSSRESDSTSSGVLRCVSKILAHQSQTDAADQPTRKSRWPTLRAVLAGRGRGGGNHGGVPPREILVRSAAGGNGVSFNLVMRRRRIESWRPSAFTLAILSPTAFSAIYTATFADRGGRIEKVFVVPRGRELRGNTFARIRQSSFFIFIFDAGVELLLH